MRVAQENRWGSDKAPWLDPDIEEDFQFVDSPASLYCCPRVTVDGHARMDLGDERNIVDAPIDRRFKLFTGCGHLGVPDSAVFFSMESEES